jgi:hypothetical protein
MFLIIFSQIGFKSLTETLAIFAALVIYSFLKARLHVDELNDVNCEGVYHFRLLFAQGNSPLHKQDSNITFLRLLFSSLSLRPSILKRAR